MSFITIEDFTETHIIRNLSPLIQNLTETKFLTEEENIELWNRGAIDYESVHYELDNHHCYTVKIDNQWGIKSFLTECYKIEPLFKTEEAVIEEYLNNFLNSSLEDYRGKVYEHWQVTNFLADRLREKREAVVTFCNINVWCRCTEGIDVREDGCIEEIYKELTEN